MPSKHLLAVAFTEAQKAMTDDRETGAREIACGALSRVIPYGDGCVVNNLCKRHSITCNALTAAITSYGDTRAAGERERCAKVAEARERLICGQEPPDTYMAQATARNIATAIRES
jgi:hypothetical protein